MPDLKRVWLSWSSGKDSAWSLHVLRQQREVEVVGLLTSFNGAANRVAMHAVRRTLVEEQAKSAGVPLRMVDLPSPCSNEAYQAIMAGAWEQAIAEGVSGIAFGDLFLEDVRAYREAQLKPTALTPLFPLWQIPTVDLAKQMCAAGLRATITCVDPKQLGREFAGMEWSDALKTFPHGVDVCGERGEFHTFAYAGPMVSRTLSVQTGEVLERDGFVFADVRTAPRSSENAQGFTCRSSQLDFEWEDTNMTIEIHRPELEALIHERMASGASVMSMNCLQDPSARGRRPLIQWSLMSRPRAF